MIPLTSMPRRFPSMRYRTKVIVCAGGFPVRCKADFQGFPGRIGQAPKKNHRSVIGSNSLRGIVAGIPTSQNVVEDEFPRFVEDVFANEASPKATGRTPLLNTTDPDAQRAEIRRYFHATFDKTEQLFSLLACDDAYYIKHEPLRHPPIFYYGHTACFFINKLLLGKIIDKRVNPKIEHACAVGVDEMSWDDLNEKHYDWPTVQELQDYRDEVRGVVDTLIQTLPMPSTIDWKSPWWPILMGIEHENIHIETSSAIFRQAPLDMLKPNQHWPICQTHHLPPTNQLLDVPASTVVCQKERHNGRVYGWDNEYGLKTSRVPAFRASKYLVSNHEYLQFVQDGGYEHKQFWSDEGWTWVEYTAAKHPKYWRQLEDGNWVQRHLAEETPVPWSWPAIVNQLEAKAFCNWKAKKYNRPIRLPSEDEWKAIRQLGECGQIDQPDWKVAPGNINLEHFASECPVSLFEWGGTGFYDVIGNVWQWTESPIDGLPGFEVHPLYDDFSTPTFDGKHNLFKGGSWISIGCNGATAASRYAFRRHFFQHAGIRYVESELPVDQSMNLYETDPLVLRQLDAHYSKTLGIHGMPSTPYAQRCAAEVANVVSKLCKPTDRILDLGCSVGRRTFELATTFKECIGVDHSARYIKAAVRLQDGQIVRYTVPIEGVLNSFHEASLNELGLDASASKCLFVQQPDMANLDLVKLGVFDVVCAFDVLEKLSNPRGFLEHLHAFVQPGGLLILSSNYNWSSDNTADADWIGGYKDAGSGENVTTLSGVAEILKPHFNKLEIQSELVAVQRETLRNLTVDVSDLTVWERLQ